MVVKILGAFFIAYILKDDFVWGWAIRSQSSLQADQELHVLKKKKKQASKPGSVLTCHLSTLNVTIKI
jgi:hypothetical protein